MAKSRKIKCSNCEPDGRVFIEQGDDFIVISTDQIDSFALALNKFSSSGGTGNAFEIDEDKIKFVDKNNDVVEISLHEFNVECGLVCDYCDELVEKCKCTEILQAVIKIHEMLVKVSEKLQQSQNAWRMKRSDTVIADYAYDAKAILDPEIEKLRILLKGRAMENQLARNEVYDLIDDERDYQDSLSSDRTDGSDHTVGDYLTMIHTYVDQATDAWTKNPGTTPALDEIRKIAAIAVRCMEEHGASLRKR